MMSDGWFIFLIVVAIVIAITAMFLGLFLT